MKQETLLIAGWVLGSQLDAALAIAMSSAIVWLIHWRATPAVRKYLGCLHCALVAMLLFALMQLDPQLSFYGDSDAPLGPLGTNIVQAKLQHSALVTIWFWRVVLAWGTHWLGAELVRKLVRIWVRSQAAMVSRRS